MKYEITNGASCGKVFKVFGGTYEVKRGKTEIVDVEGGLTKAQIEYHKASGVEIVEAPDEDSKQSKPAKDDKSSSDTKDDAKSSTSKSSGTGK